MSLSLVWRRTCRGLATGGADRNKRAKFIDRVRILAKGGDGGDGCASRFRDTLVENGPANGGNGGRGGDVYVVASHNVSDLRFPTKNFSALAGARGQGDNLHGARGKRKNIMVPCGTVVHRVGSVNLSGASCMEPFDAPRTLLAELLNDGDEFLVARGGAKGRGNASFHSGLQQHSSVAEDGGAGEAVTLMLSLKLIADIGLVGFPNAGKSSLLRALTNATPEVASYPFTTLHPHLGRVDVTADDHLTIADIPGLIDGAADNKGLGHKFLAHVERTSLFCYVLDLADAEISPVEQLTALRGELNLYKPGLADHPCMIVGNKADAEGASEALQMLRGAVAKMMVGGELPGIVATASPLAESGGGGSGGGGGGGGSAESSTHCSGSAVTAISALHAKNLPRLVQRMHSNMLAARRRLKALEEQEAKKRVKRGTMDPDAPQPLTLERTARQLRGRAMDSMPRLEHEEQAAKPPPTPEELAAAQASRRQKRVERLERF